MKEILIPSVVSPTKWEIGWMGGKSLTVLSPCCHAVLFIKDYGSGVMLCATCGKELLRPLDKLAWWAQADDENITGWISSWTGIPESEITVEFE